MTIRRSPWPPDFPEVVVHTTVALRDGHPDYVVDDHVGLGGTLANLRGHIESEGGRVVLTTTLSASRRSEVLALRPETLHALREKHGERLERYWQEHFGFGLDALTEAEAGYLLRTPSFDAVRDRMAEAGGQGLPRALRGDQGPGDGGA